MLIERDHSALLVVDVQEKLLPTIAAGDVMLANQKNLLGAAAELKIPCVFTEQLPDKLGASVAELKACYPDAGLLIKSSFSAVADKLLEMPQLAKAKQIILIGIEAHVCVLQTVLDLRAAGREVFVLADGIGSRLEQNKQLAITRMHGAGAQIVSREMVLFEWLRRAGTDEFKQIHRQFIV